MNETKKQFTLFLDFELHKWLKMEALKRQTTMQKLIHETLEAWKGFIEEE